MFAPCATRLSQAFQLVCELSDEEANETAHFNRGKGIEDLRYYREENDLHTFCFRRCNSETQEK